MVSVCGECSDKSMCAVFGWMMGNSHARVGCHAAQTINHYIANYVAQPSIGYKMDLAKAVDCVHMDGWI